MSYLKDVIKKLTFDTIYHEHMSYHALYPLINFFYSIDLKILDFDLVEAQGGSIRVITQKKIGAHKRDKSVSDLITLERKLGLNRAETITDFENHINTIRDKFRNLIQKIKGDGKSIAAFGASTKATTLSYHFQMERNHIDFIVDDNPLKQGLYSPGKHIPVYDASKIYSEKPDYLLILAWNFADSIMEKHQQFRSMKGSFILPMPSPLILKN